MDASHTNKARAPERRGNTQVYFETFFMAGVLSSQSYLQMKTLSAALEQSEEIMQWINVISARCGARRPVTFRPPYAIDATRIHQTRSHTGLRRGRTAADGARQPRGQLAAGAAEKKETERPEDPPHALAILRAVAVAPHDGGARRADRAAAAHETGRGRLSLVEWV